jgi:hypothetical protein
MSEVKRVKDLVCSTLQTIGLATEDLFGQPDSTTGR